MTFQSVFFEFIFSKPNWNILRLFFCNIFFSFFSFDKVDIAMHCFVLPRLHLNFMPNNFWFVSPLSLSLSGERDRFLFYRLVQKSETFIRSPFVCPSLLCVPAIGAFRKCRTREGKHKPAWATMNT